MNIDPTLLRALVAVHECGGFTRAGKRLNLTQSAVSHQIRRLEEQLGQPLLLRTTRRLSLTEDGQDVLQHAQQILASLDALARRFQPSRLGGVVRFGVPETFMGERLPPLLCQFSRAFPEVRLDVSVGTYLDLRKMLKAGELDLAVVLSETGQRDSGEVLRSARFVWVAAEHFDLAPGASLPLALAPAPCVNRQIGLDALGTSAGSWHLAFSSPSQEGIRNAVLAGLGVTVQMASDLRPGLRMVDGEYGLPTLPGARFLLAWSSGEKSAAAEAFGQLLVHNAEPQARGKPLAKEIAP
ncbi:LysR family transcriptional regulator [Pseudomonas sp. CF161]|uniref:LysR family transcriptional regulator n=1 Tax=Pseudomonas sp. CF161 TaxID=911241 RepID=UPI00035502D4|nr:LysR substrate-binding domain-containing protein [Pseudomonas sp. CF161]EPL06937.1 LysR family transcriptional regulator [Pseudomonas sp. CF161]